MQRKRQVDDRSGAREPQGRRWNAERDGKSGARALPADDEVAGSEAAPHRVGEVPGNAVDDDDQPPILLRWKGKGRAGDDDEGIPAGTETPQIAPPGVGGAGDKLVRHHSRDLILPERQSEVRLRHLSRSADSAADRPPTPSRSVTRSDGRAPAHPLGQTSEERGRSSRSCAKRRRVNPPRSDPRADEQADDEASPSARPEAIAPVSCQAPMHCQAPDPIGHASEPARDLADVTLKAAIVKELHRIRSPSPSPSILNWENAPERD